MPCTDDHVVDNDPCPNCGSTAPGDAPYSLGRLMADAARMIEALSRHEQGSELRADANRLVMDLRDLASEFARD